MTTSPTPLQHAPIVAGRYTVRGKLGAGSLGTVYLVWDEVERRLAALKILRGERLLADPVRRMQREFRAVASLDHPRIAAAYDFGYLEGSRIPFYTREYVPGAPLAPGPPRNASPKEFLRPILDLLEALEYLHLHRILHLDIHAGNLIVVDDAERRSVLIDIGLLAAALEVPTFHANQSHGPFPPELLDGSTPGAETDLYLVGRLLRERLTGRRAGEAALPVEIPGWGVATTLALERILGKAIEPDRSARFRSAAEFRSALARTLGEEVKVAPTSGALPSLRGRHRELARIDAVLEVAAGGERGCLWVWGPTGIGKSRLLGEARLRAQLRGLPTVDVCCTRTDDLSREWAQRFVRAVGEVSPATGLTASLSASEGGTARERARRVVADTLERARRPVTLLIDDFDGTSDALLREFVEAWIAACDRRRPDLKTVGPGMALVIVTTLPPAHPLPAVDVLEVPSLSQADARRLLQEMGGELQIPQAVCRRALKVAKGVPLYLHQIVEALKDSWGLAGSVPEQAELPPVSLEGHGAGIVEWSRLEVRERRLLETLAGAERTVRAGELAAVLGESVSFVASALGRWVRYQVVAVEKKEAAARRYGLALTETADRLRGRFSQAALKALHARLADALLARRRRDLVDDQHLAVSSLRAGRLVEGRRRAREVAVRLSECNASELALGLLKFAIEQETDASEMLSLAESLSELAGEIGEHEEAAAILASSLRSAHARIDAATHVRVLRRLGVHLHRSGQTRAARETFEQAMRKANPERDVVELLLIDTEIAEMDIFSGDYDAATEACDRGLLRLEAPSVSDSFKRRMEVMLRASRGHVALRRLDLETAREELSRAIELGRDSLPDGDRAAILQNLGVAENQLGRLTDARHSFQEAEAILRGVGERRNIGKVATNLAVIAAKVGDRREAYLQIQRAERLLGKYPDMRLGYFAAYSRGVVALLFGEADEAAAAFERAIAQAQRVGDSTFGRFAGAYLAEAQLLMGRYGEALKGLRQLRANLPADALDLRHTVLARLFSVQSLLGSQRATRRLQQALEREAAGGNRYLEAWNEIWIGFGKLESGFEAQKHFECALLTFEKFSIPCGVRFGRLGLLREALDGTDPRALLTAAQAVATTLEEAGSTNVHLYLDVAEPLFLAAASIQLGDSEEGERWLRRATGAVVGTPFPDLDWRLELLRTQLELARGHSALARRHLHRCRHLRDLLLQFVSPESRSRFAASARFRAVEEIGARLKLDRGEKDTGSAGRPSLIEVFDGYLGNSSAMLEVLRRLESVRDPAAPVLISGETGTGKELVARALHASGRRRERVFRTVHCACLPPELFEAELFGYEEGAFTGAEHVQEGLLERVDGGTLLLDAVDQLPFESQAKLLRVIETRRIRRLGGHTERLVDVRYLATTTRDLAVEVEKGSFRGDLYYRLAVLTVSVPPLRARGEDIGGLAGYLLERHAAQQGRGTLELSEDAVKFLEMRSWPGNIRELEGLLLRALLFATRPGQRRLHASDLADLVDGRSDFEPKRNLLGRDLSEWRAELERDYLTQLFFEVDGDTNEMIRRLGMKRSKFYRWLQELGISTRKLRRRL